MVILIAVYIQFDPHRTLEVVALRSSNSWAATAGTQQEYISERSQDENGNKK